MQKQEKREHINNRTTPQFCCSNFLLCFAYSAEKEKGNVRPIAVGEVLRRLIAKCIAQEASSEAVELFSFRQLGVAVKWGAESIVNETKQLFQKSLKNEKSRLLQLKINLKPAFDSISRSRVLDATRTFISALAFCFFLLFSA